MDPEDEIVQPETPAPETPETPEAPDTENEAVSLAEAMWGDDADKDTALPEGDEGAPAAEDPPAEPETPAEPAPETPAEDTEVSDEELVKDLSEKAQHRFRELVNTNKEMERRIGGFTEIIEDAQVTPQDVVDLFAYGKAIRTGNYDQARALLAEQARQLELVSGQPVEFGDALSDYPDLQKSVEEMELTRAHALELARVRRGNEQQQRQSEQQNRQRDEQDAQTQAATNGFNEVVALAQQWGKTDLDWAVKQPMMEKRAAIIQQTYPPNRWGAMMKVAYEEITDTLKAARPAAQTRAPSALRPNGMGGGAKSPSSLHEAMWGEPEPT